MIAIAGESHQQSSTWLDDESLVLEGDLTAVERVIQIVDRGNITLGGVIGHPITLIVLPTIVRMATMEPAGTDRGKDQRFRIKWPLRSRIPQGRYCHLVNLDKVRRMDDSGIAGRGER